MISGDIFSFHRPTRETPPRNDAAFRAQTRRTHLVSTLRSRGPDGAVFTELKTIGIGGFREIPVKPFHSVRKRTNESPGSTIHRRRRRRQKSN